MPAEWQVLQSFASEALHIVQVTNSFVWREMRCYICFKSTLAGGTDIDFKDARRLS